MWVLAKFSSDFSFIIFRIFCYIFMFCVQLKVKRGIASLLSAGYITEWKRLGLCEMLHVHSISYVCFGGNSWLPPTAKSTEPTHWVAVCVVCVGFTVCVSLLICPIGAELFCITADLKLLMSRMSPKSLGIVRVSRQLCQYHIFLPKFHHSLWSPTVH